MLENILDFFYGIFIKFASRLPSNPFNFSDYFNQLREILGMVNWVVPFYLFATIFNVWLVAFTAMMGIFIVIKFMFFGRNK